MGNGAQRPCVLAVNLAWVKLSEAPPTSHTPRFLPPKAQQGTALLQSYDDVRPVTNECCPCPSGDDVWAFSGIT